MVFWLVFFVLVELALLASIRLGIRHWRGLPTRIDGFPIRRQRAWMVEMVVAAIFALALVLSFTTAESGADAPPATLVAVGILAIVSVVGVPLVFALRQWGRPRALVPPHLRPPTGP